MSMKLTSEELGDAGESKFKLLCIHAKLVCNTSSRDLTGWDFIVELPNPPAGAPNDLGCVKNAVVSGTIKRGATVLYARYGRL